MDGVRWVRGDGPIAGVQVLPQRRIPDERGTILHMLKCTDPHFQSFGEIYFATIHQGAIKGWHFHREMTLNYSCIHGRIKLVMFDDRPGSPTAGNLMEVYLGTDLHALVVIPPQVWNGFKGLGAPFSIVANCCTHTHDPARSQRMSPFDPRIPYDWAIEHQ